MILENQHGPYFQRETSGVVDSPNKKFDNVEQSVQLTLGRTPPKRQHRVYQNPTIKWNNLAVDTKIEPKVSIIMPTFRRQHIINEAVSSIINQTYANWQLIIIDNECRHPPYQFDDERIECHNHSDTPSAAYARNQGTAYIKGELVCFFDDDDRMNKDYLEKMVRPFLMDERVIMTHCQVRFDEGHTNGSYCTPSAMVKRSSITPTWRSDYHGHDQDYWGSIFGDREYLVYQIGEILVNCSTSPRGGMREGHL